MWGSKQVAEFVGVGYPTLDHWIRSDLLSCLCPSDGTGNRRSWSAGDVARAFVVRELRRRGHSLQTIRRSGVLGGLTDVAIASGALVCTVGKTIGVVPIDPDLEWKEAVDCEHPPSASAALWTLRHLSRDLSLAQQGSVTIHVTELYEEVRRQMKEESEAYHE